MRTASLAADFTVSAGGAPFASALAMSFALVSGAAARRWLPLRRLLALAAFGFSSAACSTLPAASSSAIGCFEDDIEISNAQNGPSGDSWTATCHGNVYDCVREEEKVEASGWNVSTLKYQHFNGTMKGDTYCIRRDAS
jgi:hypothetical protein